MVIANTAHALVFSGALSIFASSLIGFAMLVPMQPWGRRWAKGLNFRQIGAAHLDWIMLGLMQGLAAGLILLFGLTPPAWSIWAMIIGGWLNPLAYVFRAFGVDAFSFSGKRLQRAAAALGGITSTLIAAAWIVYLYLAIEAWP